MNTTLKSPGINEEEENITFDYIKSNNFRVIYADGVHGGLSPKGDLIQISIWNERWPIPRQTTHEFSKEGKLGSEILGLRITRDAIVREVEAEIIMTVPNAELLRDWLDEKIKATQKISKMIESTPEDEA